MGLAAWHGQARACPVLVDRGPANHAPDAVAVRLRLIQPLQHEDAAAFAPHVAVGGRVERLAAPVRSQHPRVRSQLQQPPGEDGVYAPCQRQVRLPPLQPHHRLVDRHQRRRTGGVDRHGRAVQAECEGDPPDGRVERCPANRVEAGRRLGRVAHVQDQVAVLVVADARVDPRAAALEAVRVDAGVLQGLPAGLQHEPLLRVQHLRFDGGDAEEGRVELVDVVQVGAEAAGLGLHLRVGEELADASHTRAGHALLDRALARLQQAPEGVDVVRSGEAAGHAHDRDRLVGKNHSGVLLRHPLLPGNRADRAQARTIARRAAPSCRRAYP